MFGSDTYGDTFSDPLEARQGDQYLAWAGEGNILLQCKVAKVPDPPSTSRWAGHKGNEPCLERVLWTSVLR